MMRTYLARSELKAATFSSRVGIDPGDVAIFEFTQQADKTDPPVARPLPVKAGECVRLVMTNQSMMFHPMHLHGYTFALVRPDGRGIRKDTVNVLPMQQLAVDLDADNPGQWMNHCYNVYHAELGMTTTLSYRT